MNQAMNTRGQGMIESIVAIVVAVILLFGLINIWIWGNTQIVRRQMRYGESRVAAGTSSDTYQLQWPMNSSTNLTEEEVIPNSPGRAH
jgi:hypothetical protein